MQSLLFKHSKAASEISQWKERYTSHGRRKPKHVRELLHLEWQEQSAAMLASMYNSITSQANRVPDTPQVQPLLMICSCVLQQSSWIAFWICCSCWYNKLQPSGCRVGNSSRFDWWTKFPPCSMFLGKRMSSSIEVLVSLLLPSFPLHW